MSWIALLNKESRVPIPRIAIGSALSGACRSGVLGTVVGAINVADDPRRMLEQFFFFGILVVAYKVLHAFELERISAEIEDIVHRLRVRIIDKLQRAELRHHEKLSQGAVNAVLNTELPAIGKAVITLFNAIQAGTTILFTMLFVGSLSQTAFFFIFFGAAFTLSTQAAIFRRIRADMAAAYGDETALNEVVGDALDGFRETKLDSRKRLGLRAVVSRMSETLGVRRKRVQRLLAQQLVMAQVSYMVLTGLVVFIAPKVDPTFHEVMLKTAICMVFLMGPLNTFVGALQVLINVNAAADNVMELEATVDRMAEEEAAHLTAFDSWSPAPDGDAPARPLPFAQSVALSGVTFVHHTTPELKPFRAGPLDLEIRKGDLVLIVGGNGSGKSTMLHLLTGLYRPTNGTITVDGQTVTPGSVQRYRELFGVIFTNHHLFTRLYGLETIDLERLDALLDYTGLTGKTSYQDDRFETIKLSTGQRKRLALVEMLMEDKEILVFDEWAAEQDPPSRARFYDEILPALRARGKTIIAVSHDDAFFHVANVRVTMELGKITSIERRIEAPCPELR
ncbi:ATP-binding cassette domain-containing protein [Azospirillum sp. sgz302134]